MVYIYSLCKLIKHHTIKMCITVNMYYTSVNVNSVSRNYICKQKAAVTCTCRSCFVCISEKKVLTTQKKYYMPADSSYKLHEKEAFIMKLQEHCWYLWWSYWHPSTRPDWNRPGRRCWTKAHSTIWRRRRTKAQRRRWR